jgi:hypothetical protein
VAALYHLNYSISPPSVNILKDVENRLERKWELTRKEWGITLPVVPIRNYCNRPGTFDLVAVEKMRSNV